MGRNLSEYGRPKICCGRLRLRWGKVFHSHTKRIHNTEKATIDVKEFVGLIKQPRAIMLLVPAGKPVDTAIESLLLR
jgi:6-phosphogluconate dehydrogenase